MRRSVLALALCALLALAGCNGLFPSSDATTAPTETTTTPATDYPPGLVSNGITSPSTLADVHRNALGNTSYATETTLTASHGDATTGTRTETVRVAAGGVPYVVTENDTGSFPGTAAPNRFTTWVNESASVSRLSYNDTTRLSADAIRPNPDGGASRVHALYLALHFDVTHTGDGYVLTATGVRQPDAVSPLFSNETDVSATIHLSDSGVVQSYHLRFDATFRDDHYHVVERFELAQVGGVTVEKPPWVAEALNRTV